MTKAATKPNFVLAGAPKSGTTAMADYLRSHPNVFVSDIKEPFYYADDMPAMRRSTGFDSEAKYRQLFRDAGDQHHAVGEGSTLYLMSESALRNALGDNPKMKFIFMLRRPSEIAVAYHMQMRLHEMEDIESFEDAWSAIESRRRGERPLPPRCIQPELIQYDRVASIGDQLVQAFETIPSSQRLVLLFDDFVADVRQSYLEVLAFLELPDDGRDTFERTNAARQTRFPVLTRLLRSPTAVAATRVAKRYLGGGLYDSARALKHGVMFRSQRRPPLAADVERDLCDFFVPQVQRLENLLQRDLSHWKVPKPSAESASTETSS